MLADESSRLDVNASPGVAASARTYTELEARLFSCNSIEGGRTALWILLWSENVVSPR